MKFRLFKNRNFSLFVVGQSTSLFGTVFLNIALSLYILSITGSASKFSLVLSLGILPQLFLGLFAGVIVDRVNRRKLILWLDLVRGIYLLALFGYSLVHPLGEWLIYLTVFAFGICDLFFTPAFVTILPSIVKQEELVDANALQSTITEATKTFGPIFGSLLYAMSGIGMVMLVDGLTFFVSVLTTFYMVFQPVTKAAKQLTVLQDVRVGLGTVFRRDVRVTSLVLNGMLTHIFLHSFIMVAVPYMLVNIFGGSDVQFGTVQTMVAAGSICAIIAVSFIKKRFNTSQSIGLGVLGMTVAVLPFFALGNHSFLHVLGSNSIVPVTFFSIVTFAIYFMFNTYSVFFIAFYQRVIPLEMLGRYLSVSSLMYAIGRLVGFKMYGFLLDHSPLVISVVVLGVGMMSKIFMHLPFMKHDKRLNQLAEPVLKPNLHV